jgi:dihydropteroate synthase
VPVLGAVIGAGATVSIDTSSAEVARRGLAAGAHVINDVTALGDPGMAAAIVEARAGVVLMHMRETPATMQRDPVYGDPIAEIRDWLAERVAYARGAGIDASRIAIDPGIGFGKTAGHNLELIAGLDAFAALGQPVLVGLSRKRFLGTLLDLEAGERLEAGLAATAVAVFRGADIVRTHDVRATVRAVRMSAALRAARRTTPSASRA